MRKNYLLLLILIVLSSATVWSQKIWDGPATGGSWALAANWNNNTIPVAGQTVTFDNGVSGAITNVPALSISGLVVSGNSNIILQAPAAVTLNISNGTVSPDLTIDAGSEVTLGTNVNMTLANGATATVTGRLNVNANRTYTTTGITTIIARTGILNNAGTVTSTASDRLVFQDSAFYIHARDGGGVPTGTWNDSSFVLINGITATAPNGLTQAFGNFNWNAAGQSANINLNGTLTRVDGNLTIANTTLNDTLVLTSGPNLTLNLGGNLVLGSAGNFANLAAVKNGNGNVTLNVTGNYTQLLNTDFILNDNNNASSGTVTLNITGNFLQSGGIFNFVESDETAGSGLKASMNLTGNFSQTGGLMESTAQDVDILNGRITFNKNGVQTFFAATPINIRFVNFVIPTNNVLELNSDLRLSRDDEPNFRGNLTVASGGTLNTSTFSVSSLGAGAAAVFTLSSGAKLITASPTGVQGAINTANLTTSLNSGADYEIRGGSTGVFTTTIPNTVRDLIINNTGGNVLLGQPLTVNRSLNLTAGAITTSDNNLLTIGATGTTTGAIAGSFVNGPLAKVGTVAFTFPVGKVGAGFRNIGITAPSVSSTFRAEFFRATPPPGTLDAGITQISRCEYWNLTRIVGTGTARVILSWEPESPCAPGAPYVTDPTTLRVAHLLGGTWVNEGRQTSSGDNTKGTVTSNNIVAIFSPFTLASSTAAANPLPVLFANEKAYEKDNGIQLEWSNMTETDVASYTVEHSGNGREFTSIEQKLPVSNQNTRADYSAFDGTPSAGVNYYRIKAEETSGKIVYSKILVVNRGNTARGLNLYPNPVIGNRVTITLSNIEQGQYNLRVISNVGQDVYKQVIQNQSSLTTQTLDLPLSVKPGVYTMLITGDNYRESKIFIVQ